MPGFRRQATRELPLPPLHIGGVARQTFWAHNSHARELLPSPPYMPPCLAASKPGTPAFQAVLHVSDLTNPLLLRAPDGAANSGMLDNEDVIASHMFC